MFVKRKMLKKIIDCCYNYEEQLKLQQDRIDCLEKQVRKLIVELNVKKLIKTDK